MPNCCGIVDIRRGVIAIGAVGILASLATLSILFWSLAKEQHLLKDSNDEAGKNLFSLIFVLGIIVCFFKFVSDLLVVYGAVKRTTTEVSVWLIINLCTILYIFITMVFLYGLFVSHLQMNKEMFACIQLIILLTNIIYIYLWYQVYMFSRQLFLDGRTSLEGILQNGYNSNA